MAAAEKTPNPVAAMSGQAPSAEDVAEAPGQGLPDQHRRRGTR